MAVKCIHEAHDGPIIAPCRHWHVYVPYTQCYECVELIADALSLHQAFLHRSAEMQHVDPALTIVPIDHIRKPEDEEEEESSSEEEEVDLPPGPISSEHCTVGGPGFVGGSAKAPISFYVTAKDEADKRIREGGAYVTATVNPGNSARAGGAQLVFAEIRDNHDGTYTATYSVEARGDYEVR